MKVAVIGTGFGASLVAPVYRDLGIEVDLVSPRDAAAVRRACASAVDLVSVHSPPFLHRDHVRWAVENGRNVLCDKPFGTSVADAREMLATAEAADVIHLLNFEFRHDPARLQVKSLIDEGAIGSLRHVSWSMFSGASRSMPFGWLFDEGSGGGWIGAYGSHVIDTLRWWVGDEVQLVTGIRRTDVATRRDVEGMVRACTAEDAFSGCLTFSGGSTATIDTAFAVAGSRPQHIEVFGTDGRIVLDGSTELVLLREGEAPRWCALPTPDVEVHRVPFTNWVMLVVDAIRGGNQIEPSFVDGVECAVVMEALRESTLTTKPFAA